MITRPEIKTALPGPKASAIIARDARRISTSYTRDYPFVMAKGEGAVVEDVDGNVFLDCAAGIAVTSTGHSHPNVVKAIVDQAHKYLHMSGTDFYYELQVQLGEVMAGIVPIDGEVRSFFGNSGTEANEAALKLAKYSTKRTNIIAFLGSFHGRSMGSLAATSSKARPGGRWVRLTEMLKAIRYSQVEKRAVGCQRSRWRITRRNTSCTRSSRSGAGPRKRVNKA